jgi:SAM-dependent methyltransferase
MTDVQKQVREFYDQVGWKPAGGGEAGSALFQSALYQNALFEDLRPVSREYIHRCHLRVGRHLAGSGQYLLDAGSGPIQYPEYLAYSEGRRYRVCADLSITALQEARNRLTDAGRSEHGLYVVCDVTQLPFAPEVFEGAVSLHTFHHLPVEAQATAFGELYRVLAPGQTAVVVNGWSESALMSAFNPLVRLSDRIRGIGRRLSGKKAKGARATGKAKGAEAGKKDKPKKGTYSQHINVEWLKENVIARAPQEIEFEVRVWRSVSVRFLRSLMHGLLGGKLWLRLLYWLEEKWPRWFGEKGAYPLIVVKKG